MQWHSAGEFLAMGGYALYVWGSVGVCALAMIAEPLLLRRRHRHIVRSLRQRRDAAGSVRAAAVAAEVTR